MVAWMRKKREYLQNSLKTLRGYGDGRERTRGNGAYAERDTEAIEEAFRHGGRRCLDFRNFLDGFSGNGA